MNVYLPENWLGERFSLELLALYLNSGVLYETRMVLIQNSELDCPDSSPMVLLVDFRIDELHVGRRGGLRLALRLEGSSS